MNRFLAQCQSLFSMVGGDITNFAALENQDLGVVKTLRKPAAKLNLSPFFAPT